VAGMPPLSGFLGKLLMLRSAGAGSAALELWSLLLVTSLVAIVALSRAGNRLFWRNNGKPAEGPRTDPLRLAATLGLLLSSVVRGRAARRRQAYLAAAAAPLLAVAPYRRIVEGGEA